MGNCHTVGPNEALVVSGGCCGSDQKTYVVGGWAWAWWLISDIQRMSLEVMTILCRCENIETAEGVPLDVTGVAQVIIYTRAQQSGADAAAGLEENIRPLH
uniref:Flotillin n=1 Tax=Knipowitschia caucasica TaxID=637954 RepID=A0AAV2J8A8_KNICA